MQTFKIKLLKLLNRTVIFVIMVKNFNRKFYNSKNFFGAHLKDKEKNKKQKKGNIKLVDKACI